MVSIIRPIFLRCHIAMSHVRGGRRGATERGMQRIRRYTSPGVSAFKALALLLLGPAGAKSAPAATLRDLFKTLNECLLKAPSGIPGCEVTVVFSLKRDGSLLGRPRISHARLFGDPDAQRSFVAGALATIAKCLPINVTDGLGGAIAGRPLSVRIVSRMRETDTLGRCFGPRRPSETSKANPPHMP
jgi:hypothetical protein